MCFREKSGRDDKQHLVSVITRIQRAAGGKAVYTLVGTQFRETSSVLNVMRHACFLVLTVKRSTIPALGIPWATAHTSSCGLDLTIHSRSKNHERPRASETIREKHREQSASVV